MIFVHVFSVFRQKTVSVYPYHIGVGEYDQFNHTIPAGLPRSLWVNEHIGLGFQIFWPFKGSRACKSVITHYLIVNGPVQEQLGNSLLYLQTFSLSVSISLSCHWKTGWKLESGQVGRTSILPRQGMMHWDFSYLSRIFLLTFAVTGRWHFSSSHGGLYDGGGFSFCNILRSSELSYSNHEAR